jgi:hypothetical protein
MTTFSFSFSLSFSVLSLLHGAANAVAQQDTTALRKEMRNTASAYESALRSKAPFRMMQASNCDENVGRYCVMYDRGIGRSLPPEPAAIKQARSKAIESFRRGVEVWPTDSTIVAPLVRFLVDGDQARDAVAVAQTFASKTTDPDWAQLLVGLALHGTGDDASAESVFARTLAKILPNERRNLHDVTSLLDPQEQPRYRALSGTERARYHERLWRLADPLYLTDGNESLVEHFSRGVYGRILAYSPTGEGAWGPDVAELTLRFGVPTARTQNFGDGMGGKQLTEHFDPNQLTFIPPAQLTRPALHPFEPGGVWPYDTIRSRSGYAPRSFRRMMVLEHQVTRFPGKEGGELRADYVLPLDSVTALPARFEVALYALDAEYQIVGQMHDTVSVDAAGTAGNLSMPLPPGTVAYSLEALEISSRLAARARYQFPVRSGGLAISDIVIMSSSDAPPPSSRAVSEFRPMPALVIPRGDAITLYLEVQGLAVNARRRVEYRVELEVLEQNNPGAVARVVRGLGRVLGMSGDDVAPRVTWNQEQNAQPTTVVALKLGQIQLAPGLKQFKITLTDTQNRGRNATTERLIRISDVTTRTR